MAKYNVRVDGKYRKCDAYCRRGGCHNPPAPNFKYCLDCFAIERSRSLAKRAETRLEVMNALGGVKCAVPGCRIYDPLMREIDHKRDDGNKDNRHPTALIRALRRLCRTSIEQARDRFQVLCSGHNKQKEIFRARGWEWSLSIASQRLKEFVTSTAD
jgi:hypothetical protein